MLSLKYHSVQPTWSPPCPTRPARGSQCGFLKSRPRPGSARTDSVSQSFSPSSFSIPINSPSGPEVLTPSRPRPVLRWRPSRCPRPTAVDTGWPRGLGPLPGVRVRSRPHQLPPPRCEAKPSCHGWSSAVSPKVFDDSCLAKGFRAAAE